MLLLGTAVFLIMSAEQEEQTPAELSYLDANSWVYVVEDCMCNTFVFMLQDKRPDLYIYKYWNGHNSDLIVIQPKPVEQMHALLGVETSTDLFALASQDSTEQNRFSNASSSARSSPAFSFEARKRFPSVSDSPTMF